MVSITGLEHVVVEVQGYVGPPIVRDLVSRARVRAYGIGLPICETLGEVGMQEVMDYWLWREVVEGLD
jgi:hypothetical protein